MVDYYIFNEFSTRLVQLGFFNRNVTSADIPSNIPFKLNTEFFANMIPGLYELYPNKDLILYVSSNSTVAPNLKFDQEHQTIVGNINTYKR